MNVKTNFASSFWLVRSIPRLNRLNWRRKICLVIHETNNSHRFVATTTEFWKVNGTDQFENLPILPCLSNEVAPPCDEELELLPVPPLPILLRRRQTQQQQISIETKPNNTPPAAAPIIMAKFESFRSFLPPGKPTWKYKCLIYSIENLVILILSP